MTEKDNYKKSESEFLQGVYQKIVVLEKEKKELEKVRSLRRRELKRKLKIIFVAIFLNIPFLVMLPEMIATNNQGLIMGWSFLLISLGSFIQYSSEIRRDFNGN